MKNNQTLVGKVIIGAVLLALVFAADLTRTQEVIAMFWIGLGLGAFNDLDRWWSGSSDKEG